VGRATKLAIRRTNHASALRNNTHQNRLLQRHWNVTSDPMWFVVLERWPNTISRFRRGLGEHPRELLWKSRLRPLYDAVRSNCTMAGVLLASIACRTR